MFSICIFTTQLAVYRTAETVIFSQPETRITCSTTSVTEAIFQRILEMRQVAVFSPREIAKKIVHVFAKYLQTFEQITQEFEEF